MTKRLLAVVLAVMMVIGCTVSANAYTDVSATDKHALAIETLSNMEIIVGTTATEFNPNGLITREQMALLIARLSTALRVDASQGAANNSGFTDVVDSTYFDAINYCKNFGIIQGRDETTYDPKGNIILQDAVTMAVRAMGYTDLPYPAGYIQRGAIFGLFANLTGSYTAPITRAEAAQLMYNALYSNYFTIDGGLNKTTMMDEIYRYNKVSGEVVATPNFRIDGEASAVAAPGTIKVKVPTIYDDDNNIISLDDIIPVDDTVVKNIDTGNNVVVVAKADADALLGATCDIYTYTTVKGTKIGLKFGDSLINTNWFLSGAQSNGFGENTLKITDGKITIFGNKIASNKISYVTINNGAVSAPSSTGNTTALCITTAIVDGDGYKLIQRPVHFGKVTEVTESSKKVLKVGTMAFADTLGLKSAAVANGDNIFYVEENGKATAIMVAAPEELRYAESGTGYVKLSNNAKYALGGTFTAPAGGWKVAEAVAGSNPTTYAPVKYNVYTLGNMIYSAEEKEDGTPDSPVTNIPEETTYVAKNYLIVRNIVDVPGSSEPVYDANGIPTTTIPTKYFAYAWMNGALTKIEIDTVDGEAVTSSPLSGYVKDISSDPATTDIYAFCAYEYDATKNTYKLYTVDEESDGGSSSWDKTAGKWNKETAFNNGSITKTGKENLGDAVLALDSVGSGIDYNADYGVFTVDGKRFKLGTDSKITVAVAKEANGNKYYEYKDYSAAKLPNFDGVAIEKLVGVFCGTNSGTDWAKALLQAVNVYVVAAEFPDAPGAAPDPTLQENSVALVNGNNAYKGLVYNEAGVLCYNYEALMLIAGQVMDINIPVTYNSDGTVKPYTEAVGNNIKALILNSNGDWVAYNNIVDGPSASGYNFINISGNQYFINAIDSGVDDEYKTLTMNGVVITRKTNGKVEISTFANGNIASKFAASKTGYLTIVKSGTNEIFWVIQSETPATGNTYLV